VHLGHLQAHTLTPLARVKCQRRVARSVP
jgi:hypothetical protein